MAVAVLDLYIDTAQKLLMGGPSGASALSANLRFIQGDTVTMRIRCLSPTPNFPNSNPPYTLIGTAGRTLQLAVGDRAGNLLTQQFTWSAGGTTADPYFTADVAFNTTEIDTFLQNVATRDSLIQINLVEGTPRTIFLSAITLEAAVIKPNAVAIGPGLTPASMEAVLALLENIRTKSLTIVSLDESHSRRLWESNDGTPYDEQSP